MSSIFASRSIGLVTPNAFYRGNLGSHGSGTSAKVWTVITSGSNVNGVQLCSGVLWGAGRSSVESKPAFTFPIQSQIIAPGLALTVETQRDPTGTFDVLNIRTGTSYIFDTFGGLDNTDAVAFTQGNFYVNLTLAYRLL
jgi:hypothetical protein